MTGTALIARHKLERSQTGSSSVGVIIGAASSGVPPHEQWLYRVENKVALKMVRDGIADLRQGRVRDLGSFAKHVEDDTE